MIMGLVLGTVAKDVRNLGNGDKRVSVDGFDDIFQLGDLKAVDHEIDHRPAGVGIKAGGMNLGDALLKGFRESLADLLSLGSDDHG